MGFIYIIRCSENDKVYIGQTTLPHLYERWKVHRHMARKYIAAKANPELKEKINGGFSHLYRAMAHHGLEKFTIECLEEADDELLDALEEAYILQFDSIRKGYNIKEGGHRTRHCEVVRNRISERTKKAFEKPEVVTKMRKYAKELEGLPPKCTYSVANNRPCYRIRRHAYIRDKMFYVCSYESPEACKQALIDYINSYSEN
jgi:group I intron endonuclease